MTRPEIKFSYVRSQEEFDSLSKFAASFGHVVDEHTYTPIVQVFRGERLFAYVLILAAPILIPAFHPIDCSPRDFKETCEQMRAWQCLNTSNYRYPNGHCFIALDNQPAIESDIIRGLGFADTKAQLWQYPEVIRNMQ